MLRTIWTHLLSSSIHTATVVGMSFASADGGIQTVCLTKQHQQQWQIPSASHMDAFLQLQYSGHKCFFAVTYPWWHHVSITTSAVLSHSFLPLRLMSQSTREAPKPCFVTLYECGIASLQWSTKGIKLDSRCCLRLNKHPERCLIFPMMITETCPASKPRHWLSSSLGNSKETSLPRTWGKKALAYS